MPGRPQKKGNPAWDLSPAFSPTLNPIVPMTSVALANRPGPAGGFPRDLLVTAGASGATHPPLQSLMETEASWEKGLPEAVEPGCGGHLRPL